MPTVTKTTAVPLWHYSCPECGIGHEETGYKAAAHALYCEVCQEDGQQVRLRRWPADDESGPLAHGPG